MRLMFVLGLCLGFSQIAHAEPLDDLVKAQQQTFDAWVNVPLTEQKVVFVTEPSTGYGLYKERPTNIFKSGEPLITYVEPIGYGWKTLPGDMYEMSFVADVMLKAENGDIVADQKGFSKFALQSHNANTELKLDFTMALNNVPVGKYTLTYTIHDVSGDQTSTFDQPFEIVAGTP